MAFVTAVMPRRASRRKERTPRREKEGDMVMGLEGVMLCENKGSTVVQ